MSSSVLPAKPGPLVRNGLQHLVRDALHLRDGIVYDLVSFGVGLETNRHIQFIVAEPHIFLEFRNNIEVVTYDTGSCTKTTTT